VKEEEKENFINLCNEFMDNSNIYIKDYLRKNSKRFIIIKNSIFQ